MRYNMFDINWNRFALLHTDCSAAFETLCYHLFCRKYKQKDGIRTDFNQVGLETEPIKYRGKYYGFQSKFFDKKISYKNIKSSVEKALDRYSNLDCIIVYLNLEAKTSSDQAQSIEEICKSKNVAIKWFLPNHFRIVLNQPSNLDLAELYFGKVNIIKKLSDSKSIKIDTLIRSKDYVKLALSNHENELDVESYTQKVLDSAEKLFLVSGVAGSGKSVLMRHIQNIFGGFFEPTVIKQKAAVERLGALCLFINLNNGSIRNAVALATKDISNQKFIYLLDGLDEIPESEMTSSLQFIEELAEKETTKKVIISSRLYSYNKTALKALYPSISEYSINELNKAQIDGYFKNKHNEDKKRKLNELVKKDSSIYEKISDVLTLVLLWNHINEIDSSTGLSDLIGISVNALLNDINHKKNLETLNLPAPISESIISINKHLSLFIFKNDRYSFKRQEVEELIFHMFPKCDYQAVNHIFSYLVDAFFDSNTPNNATVYSYGHRRYAEYFTMLCIEEQMKQNSGYLREHNIIINYDLFDSMLMPYIHRKAVKEKDISLALQGGLFNVYLGKDNAWGVDNDLYCWSTWIVYAIAALPKEILINAVENKGLPIYRFFYEIPKRIIETLPKENAYHINSLRRDYLMMTLLVSLLCKYNKLQWFPQLKEEYLLIRKLASKKRYYFRDVSYEDSFLFWYSQLYIDLISELQNADQVIDRILGMPIELSEWEKNISSQVYYTCALFYNLILYNQQKCAEVIGRLSINQLSVFAFSCCRPECLSVILREGPVKDALVTSLINEIDNDSFEAVVCIALKRVIGIDLSEKELTCLDNYLSAKKFKSYWVLHKELSDFVSFLICTCENYASYVDKELKKYSSVYISCYQFLKGVITEQEFFKYALFESNTQTEGSYYILILIGKVLSTDSVEHTFVVDYLTDILDKEKQLVVFHVLKRLSSNQFHQTVSISVINGLMDHSFSDSSFESTGDQLFMLSYITSDQDGLYSYRTLLDGISKSFMRLNNRNDTLCDQQIVEALKVVLRKHWVSLAEMKSYIDRLLSFAKSMAQYHIENNLYGELLNLLLQYDFNAAEYCYNQIGHIYTVYNQLHFQFALELIKRGRKIESVQTCISRIYPDIDRMKQRVELDYYYKRIELFLRVADTDYYSKTIKNGFYRKARKEIDLMVKEGWERSLSKELYDVYTKLCLINREVVNVNLKEYLPYSVVKKERMNSFEVLTAVDDREGLFDFIDKTKSVAVLDTVEINNLLIDKSLELCGDISKIIEQMKKCYYPSNTYFCVNSEYFWMTTVCALKNSKSKNEMMNYLLDCGGGHDGFCELIKINGELDNKKTTIELFERLLDCVEFLLS